MSETMRAELLERAASTDIDGEGCALTSDTVLSCDVWQMRRVHLAFGGPNQYVDFYWYGADASVIDDDPDEGRIVYAWGGDVRTEDLCGDHAAIIWQALQRDADELRAAGGAA